MSGTLPVNNINTVTITSNTPSYTSTTLSGRRQVRQIASQYWQIEAEFVPLSRREMGLLSAFISSQSNNFSDWDIYLPDISASHGSATQVAAANPGVSDVMTVSSNTTAGATSVPFDTALNSSYFTSLGVDATLGLAAGDFIRFSNHSKVYQLTSDITFDSTGSGTLNIFPALRTSVTTSTTVDWRLVAFRVFNTTSVNEVTHNVDGTSEYTLKLQESL